MGPPRVGQGPLPPAAAPVTAAPTRTLPPYPNVSLALTLLFCGYVVIWYLQIGHRVPILGTLRFEFLYAGLLAVLVIARGPAMGSPLTGFLLALLLAMAIQVPLSQDYPISSKVFVDRVLKFAAMSLFIASFVKAPRHMAFFLGAFLLAGLKMGQEGMLGRLTGGLVWENQGVMRLHGPTPIYEHPNSFAGMALGTLPYIFYLLPLVTKRWMQALLLVTGVFSLNIVIFTGSRTGYVALAALVALLIFKSQKKFKAIATLILVVVLAAPFVPQQYLERFETIYTGKDKVGESTELRKEILRDAWAVFLRDPLGVGVAAFPAVRWRMFHRLQDTHNLYLEVATNLGIQGFVAFMLFVGAQLFLLRRLAHQFAAHRTAILARAGPGDDEVIQQEVRDLRLLEAVAHATQVFLWVRLALGLFGMDLYEIYWWFAMGLTIALYKMEKVAAARALAFGPAAESPGRTPQTRLPIPTRRPVPAMGGVPRWLINGKGSL